MQPLRAYLEAQADRVETVCAQHHVPVTVTGGTVGPRRITFHLTPEDQGTLPDIRPLSECLGFALRTAVRVSQDAEERWVIEFQHPNPRPVALLELLSAVTRDERGQPVPLPKLVALLGLTEKGVPLLFQLTAEKIRHVLITGAAHAGKSTLLRTIALSLSLTHDPADIRLVVIAPQGGPLLTVAPAPQVVRTVRQASEVAEVLRSLRTLAVHRAAAEPRVVVLGDQVATWPTSARAHLSWLQAAGPQKGLHLIVATQHAARCIPDLAPDVGLQIRGQSGRGDFQAVGAGERQPLRFQAAYVGECDAQQAIQEFTEAPYRYRGQPQRQRGAVRTAACATASVPDHSRIPA